MRQLFSSIAAVLAIGLAGAASAQTDTGTGGMFNAPGYTPGANSGVGSGRGESGAQGGAFGGAGNMPQANPGMSGLPRSPNITGGRPSTSPDASRDLNGYAPMRPIEPPKPSEFQKFVETATGRLLPVFGQNFFAESLDLPRGLDSVPVAGDYTLGPGDEVQIRAWGSIDVDYRAVVDRNGQISLPRVGTFSVAGVRAADLERHLRSQIGRVFTNFNLSATLGQLRATKVFVVGPAQRPGVYSLPSPASVLSAMVAAGGPSPTGSMRRVSVKRDGKVVADLDVYDFLVQGDRSRDVQLAAGDVVVFYPVGPRVAIAGATETPAVYELKSREEPVREVLRYSGGAPVLANPNRAQLERVDPAQRAPRQVETFQLDEPGLAKTMRDGDILTLLAISPKFANAVTLKGHVAQPLRYPWTSGMRIRDLIPDKEALIVPDFYRRKNLLVQALDEFGEPIGRGAGTGRLEIRSNQQYNGYGNPNGYGYGVDANGRPPTNPQAGANNPPGVGTPPGLPNGAYGGYGAPTGAPGNTGYPPQPGYNNNATAGTGYRGYAATYGYDERRAADREAAERTRRTPAALFDELNWDYATIERLNEKDLSTQVIAFNLGRAILQNDPTQNLELLPGDVVTVYSQKDVRVPVARQTRLVAVEGEVGSPGVYQLQAGETLKSLLRRAGGFTSQAYPYGLEFTREETRQRQRENLQSALVRLQSLASTQAARDAANRRDDDRSGSVSNAATQAQIARLSQLQPNGRIALELTPDIAAVDSLPDLPLEHGDRITVPPRPGFVTVAGAVVNTNAFVWKPGRTAGDYVRLAGVDEAADPSNMFILRADGTVTHANERRGFFGYGNVDGQVLQPGDAVIVPNQLDYETWGRALVRNLKDWSQIFSQFGLGIAAINTLK